MARRYSVATVRRIIGQLDGMLASTVLSANREDGKICPDEVRLAALDERSEVLEIARNALLELVS